MLKTQLIEVVYLNKNYFLIIGIVGIALMLALGCTTQSINKYSYETTQEQEVSEEPGVITEVTVPSETIKTSPAAAYASAMDWYPVAKEEALKWRTDAKLIEIRGDNKENSEYIAIDGKSYKWEYSFVSVSKMAKYKLTVEKGKITKNDTYDEPTAKMQYDSSPSGDMWVIDSTGAVETVNSKAGGSDLLLTRNNVKANYLLKIEGMNAASPITWIIGYYPESYGQSLVVQINGETGNII